MPSWPRIDSLKNPQIKALARLKERRSREREQRYLLEGSREISRALTAEVPVQQLFICPDLLKPEGQEVIARAHNLSKISFTELAQATFKRLSYRENPDGLIAVAAIEEKSLNSLKLPTDALVLIIDGVEKPGNLGALLRTADGANLDAVFISGTGTDLYNPNVIRASMGSLFSRPVLTTSTPELKEWLSQQQFKLVATSPQASTSYWDADYRGAVAIILGSEDLGLADDWLAASNTQVVIPMSGLADSLNVATAGALLVYEALRQRRKPA